MPKIRAWDNRNEEIIEQIKRIFTIETYVDKQSGSFMWRSVTLMWKVTKSLLDHKPTPEKIRSLKE